MPLPSYTQVHVDRPLTNLSVAYIQDANNFIADRVFPVVPVLKRSDKYFTFDRSYWYRAEPQKRAPGTESAGGGFAISTASYSADVWALHKDIDDQTRSNADDPLDLDRSATRWITQQLLLRRELQWQSTFFTTSTWTGSTTGADITPGTTWDNAASTPIEDITAQAIAMAQSTGYRPNKLVLGPQVYDKIRNHPDIIERIKYTQRAVVNMGTLDLLAQLFDVEQVLVPWAVQNTGPEGGTASYAYIYGKAAALFYAPPAAGIEIPSAGYTFAWTGFEGAGAYGNRIKRIRMEWLESDRIEGEMAFAQQLVAANLGVYFTAAVA